MQTYAKDIQHDVVIPAKEVHLDGLLYLPTNAKGIVLFAHGSGSSRLSPRNQYMASQLHEAKFATLLFDLLTAKEDQIDELTREFRFNIPLLADRLLLVTNWIITHSELKKLPIGYFGASTGGGAALLAAAEDQQLIHAVVSRGGRPDLAGKALTRVKAATLLIVGGEDHVVIQLNREAYELLQCEKELVIISGATHLFEESGKLEEVASVTTKWFEKYLK